MQSTCVCNTYKMEYNKINNLLRSEDSESENLSKFVTRQYIKVNSLSNTYNEKHLCYDRTYVVMQMLIF